LAGVRHALQCGINVKVKLCPPDGKSARATHFLAGSFASVVCSYAALVDGSSEEIERRRYSGWFTDLTDAGFIALFAGAGFILTNRVNWETQILFRFDKHPVA
jgi:hypothetical protein